MTAEQNAPRQREMLIKKPLALIRSGPGQEMRTAATIGKPTMTPESESEAGIDVLTGGGKQQIGGGAGTGIVAPVRGGSSRATTAGAENLAPTTGESDANPPAQRDPTARAAAGSSAGGATTAAGTADTVP